MQIDRRTATIGVGLAVLVAVLYAPVVGFGFVDYDDNVYVFDNDDVRRGLTRDNILGEWGRVHRGNYHPLTMLSHALDVEWYGLEAGGHHLTSVAIHLGCTLLLSVLLFRLTGDLWLAGWLAAVFAVHPLNVQSVAWIAERKNVLSTLFWFAGLLAHLGYRRGGGALRYASVLLCFAAGILSKPMLVTFPFTVWIVDAMIARGRVVGIAPRSVPWPARRAAEYAPFFAGALAVGLVTLMAQQEVGAVQHAPGFSWSVRLQTALGAYLWYPLKLILPTGLSINYLHPLDNVVPLRSLAATLFLLGGSAVAWVFRRRLPELLAGWVWYLVTLAPVSGLLTVGFQPWADRYAYVPAVGLLWAAGSAIAARLRERSPARGLLALAATLTLVACLLISRSLLPAWRDSVSLFARAVAAVPGNYIAEGNLAKALLDAKRGEESLRHFRAAAEAKPELGSVHVNLGNALSMQGRGRDAERSYATAARLEPGNPLAHFLLARSRVALGDTAGAVPSFERAVALAPELVDAQLGLASALMALGRTSRARQVLLGVLPRVTDPELRRRIESSLQRMGDGDR